MELIVRFLDATDGSSALVLIEGSWETLAKLAKVSTSVAKAVDCAFEISRLGPGRRISTTPPATDCMYIGSHVATAAHSMMSSR